MPRRTSLSESAKECAASASNATDPETKPATSLAMAMTTLAARATKTVRTLAPSAMFSSAARERRCGGVCSTAEIQTANAIRIDLLFFFALDLRLSLFHVAKGIALALPLGCRALPFLAEQIVFGLCRRFGNFLFFGHYLPPALKGATAVP